MKKKHNKQVRDIQVSKFLVFYLLKRRIKRRENRHEELKRKGKKSLGKVAFPPFSFWPMGNIRSGTFVQKQCNLSANKGILNYIQQYTQIYKI